ncbi:MAG: tetratricopeptide repeat protein [Calditrichia bacterium]
MKFTSLKSLLLSIALLSIAFTQEQSHSGTTSVQQSDVTRIIELVKAGNYNQAIQFFESFEREALGSFTSLHLVEAYHNRGKGFSDNKKYQRALKDFNKAINLADETLDISLTLVARAYVYRQLKAYDSSLKDYNTALKAAPKDVEALMGRGLTWLKLRKSKEGIADLDKAIELKADFAMAYYHRGQAYFALGRFAKASDDFRMSTVIDPDYVWAYYYNGFALENSGKAYEAKKAYRRFIERAPASYQRHIAAARKRIRLLQ